MNVVVYLGAIVVGFCGLLLGMLLMKLAPEEQDPGKDWYLLGLRGVLLLSIGIFIYFFHMFWLLDVLLLAVLGVFLYKPTLFISHKHALYFKLGIIIAVSTMFPVLFLLEVVLLFLCGMLVASLSYNQKQSYISNSKLIVFQQLVFFIPAVGIYFLL